MQQGDKEDFNRLRNVSKDGDDGRISRPATAKARLPTVQ